MLKPSKMFRRASWFVALLATLCVAQTAKAAVNYGDFVGPNVMYLQVTEEPTKIPGPTPVALFGAPNLTGDTLDFNPTGFNASASNGNFAFTDGLLTTTIMATNPNQFINQLWISEFGSYSLLGGTPAGTKAGISIDSIQAKVTQVNGVAIAPIILPKTITYTNGGAAPSTTAFGGIQFSSTGGALIGQPWSANVSFNLAAVPGATKIDLVLDNSLFAMSEQGSFAFIDKKDFQIFNTVVPEPGTIMLGLVGGLGMVLMGRKAWKKQEVA
jgi:hypothetical protein